MTANDRYTSRLMAIVHQKIEKQKTDLTTQINKRIGAVGTGLQDAVDTVSDDLADHVALDINTAHTGPINETTHGDLTGGSLHALATDTEAGFLPPADGDPDDVLTIVSPGVWAPRPPTGGMTNPMTDPGDLIVGDTGGDPIRLGIGTDGQVLTVVAGVVDWADPTGGGGGGGAYAADVGDGISTVFVITHGLGTKDVLVAVRSNSTDLYIFPDIEATSTSTVTVTFGYAPATDAYRVIISYGSTGGGFTNPMTDPGDLIVGDTGGAAIRLPIGADDDVLTVVGGVLTWAPPAGGGGGAPTSSPYVTTASDGTLSAEIVIPGLAGSPDRQSIGGSTFADEYDSSSTGLTWTPSTPGVVNANTDIPSHLRVVLSGGTEYFGLRSFAPAGDFDIRWKVSGGNPNWVTPFAILRFFVVDASNATRFGVQFVHQESQYWYIYPLLYSGSYGSPATAITYTNLSSLLYFRITRVSGTFRLWYSSDGLEWTPFAQDTTAITVAYFCIGGIDASMAIDWVRAA